MTTYTPALDALLDHTDLCDASNPMRPDCSHDDAATMLRDMLIDPDIIADSILARRCADALAAADRDAISRLALDESLCPLHMIDYAACFDDDDDECAAIRSCFPAHDT